MRAPGARSARRPSVRRAAPCVGARAFAPPGGALRPMNGLSGWRERRSSAASVHAMSGARARYRRRRRPERPLAREPEAPGRNAGDGGGERRDGQSRRSPSSSTSASSVWAPAMPPHAANASGAVLQRRRGRRVVRRDHRHVAGGERGPQRLALGYRAQRRRALRHRAEPLGVVVVEHQVVRAGLAGRVHAAARAPRPRARRRGRSTRGRRAARSRSPPRAASARSIASSSATTGREAM